MNSIYYSPEKLGMAQVAELDTAGAYEFDMVVLWRGHDGKLWAAQDSGCSCPTPFEDHDWPADFTEVRTMDDVEPLIAKVTEYQGSPSEVLDFRKAVRAALALPRNHDANEVTDA